MLQALLWTALLCIGKTKEGSNKRGPNDKQLEDTNSVSLPCYDQYYFHLI